MSLSTCFVKAIKSSGLIGNGDCFSSVSSSSSSNDPCPWKYVILPPSCGWVSVVVVVVLVMFSDILLRIVYCYTFKNVSEQMFLFLSQCDGIFFQQQTINTARIADDDDDDDDDVQKKACRVLAERAKGEKFLGTFLRVHSNKIFMQQVV